MKNDVITLIEQIGGGTDAYGDRVFEEYTRDVFCEVASVGQKEFYQAHAVGLQPEIKFILADYLDYNGEMYVSYNGTRYKVLRTYRKGQELEITVIREVNNNGHPEISR